MAAPTTLANNAASVPELWSSELYAQAENKTFWNKFEGPEGSGMPIVRKDDLSKGPGDTIHFDIALALAGAGVTDESALHGNEEILKFRQQSLTVAPLANGVSWTELAEQLISHNMRGTALNQLQKWLSGKLDDAVWTKLTAASQPAINKKFASTSTTIATVTNAMFPTLDEISEIKAYAQNTLKIEPLRMENGEEYFGLVLHPYTNLGFKKTSAYQTAQREAGIRGDSNRLFSGAAFLWDGVIGYVSNRIPTAADGDTSAVVSRNVFFGANALSRGFAQYPDWREEFFDYGRQAGVATTLIKGEVLNVFDLSAAGDDSGLTAIGSMVYYAAATAPAA